MPCYDPPPEYEGDAKRNAEEAVTIVCALVGGMVDEGTMPPAELLAWYKEHLEIDKRMARDMRSGVDPEEVNQRIAAFNALIDSVQRETPA